MAFLAPVALPPFIGPDLPMTRDELLDAVIRQSPSLPGARALTRAQLEGVPDAELQEQLDRLTRLAAARTPAPPGSPEQTARLTRLREDRQALVQRMRERLATLRALDIPAVPPEA